MFRNHIVPLSSQTVTRLIYTINSNSIRFRPPPSNSIKLPNVYTGIPYKRYTIYLENRPFNSTLFSFVNTALRRSWTKANSYLFRVNDVSIPSMHTLPSE